MKEIFKLKKSPNVKADHYLVSWTHKPPHSCDLHLFSCAGEDIELCDGCVSSGSEILQTIKLVKPLAVFFLRNKISIRLSHVESDVCIAVK